CNLGTKSDTASRFVAPCSATSWLPTPQCATLSHVRLAYSSGFSLAYENRKNRPKSAIF
ncbi:hypothetical protein LOTGIDRAFT_137523, partial [Lottia gigantea]